MSEPVRWREAGGGASSDVRELLRRAPRPRPMTAEQRARTAAKVAAVAALPATAGSAWLGGKVLGAKGLAILAAFGLLGVGLGVAVFALSGQHVVDTSPTVTTTHPSARPSTQPPDPLAPEPTPSAPLLPAALASTSKPTIVAPTVVPSTSASVDTLAQEAAILERARAAIGTDPAAALAACNEHQKGFPGGQLAAERELLAIDALGRLGRRADAKRRGEAFVAANPKSLYVERVRKLIDGL